MYIINNHINLLSNFFLFKLIYILAIKLLIEALQQFISKQLVDVYKNIDVLIKIFSIVLHLLLNFEAEPID